MRRDAELRVDRGRARRAACSIAVRVGAVEPALDRERTAAASTIPRSAAGVASTPVEAVVASAAAGPCARSPARASWSRVVEPGDAGRGAAAGCRRRRGRRRRRRSGRSGASCRSVSQPAIVEPCVPCVLHDRRPGRATSERAPPPPSRSRAPTCAGLAAPPAGERAAELAAAAGSTPVSLDVAALDAAEQRLQRDRAGDRDRDPRDDARRGAAVELQPADRQLPGDAAAGRAAATTASTDPRQQRRDADQQQHDAGRRDAAQRLAALGEVAADERQQQRDAGAAAAAATTGAASRARALRATPSGSIVDRPQRQQRHPDRGRRHRQRDGQRRAPAPAAGRPLKALMPRRLSCSTEHAREQEQQSARDQARAARRAATRRRRSAAPSPTSAPTSRIVASRRSRASPPKRTAAPTKTATGSSSAAKTTTIEQAQDRVEAVGDAGAPPKLSIRARRRCRRSRCRRGIAAASLSLPT